MHFPENQLGASLKLHFLVVGDQDRENFPENQLGASLKPGAFTEQTVKLVTSPRTNSGPH